MLEVTELKAFNIEGAIRGMRQPFKNTDKSDSEDGCHYGLCSSCDKEYQDCYYDGIIDYKRFIIGQNDLVLAQKLVKAGSPHDKFMRQIFVSMDIKAPLYW